MQTVIDGLKGLFKRLIYPQTPQGGLLNPLIFDKSPLGDLGVVIEYEAYFNV